MRSDHVTKSISDPSLTFSLENLGDPGEVLALEEAGFSPAKAAELEKSLAAITGSVSIPVRDPEDLTEEEKQKIAARQGKGKVIMLFEQCVIRVQEDGGH